MPTHDEKWNSSSNASDAAGPSRVVVPASGETPIDVAMLMGGRREVTILHAGTAYRLRVTANNKLILTK